MALNAALTTLKVVWMIEGRVESVCIRVVYDAIMIGGRGGKSDVGEVLASTGVDGW